MADLTDLTITVQTEPYIEAVPSQGRVKAGHKVVCPKCSWVSFRYDRIATAQMLRTEHIKTCRG
jgi:hypothetical protein